MDVNETMGVRGKDWINGLFELDSLDVGQLDSYPKWIIDELDSSNVGQIVGFLDNADLAREIFVFDTMVYHFPAEYFKRLWLEAESRFGYPLYEQIGLSDTNLIDVFFELDREMGADYDLSGTIQTVRQLSQDVEKLKKVIRFMTRYTDE